MKHPREVLLGAQAGAVVLPVCDHYSGVEKRMRKSLQLQADMGAEFGACVFDVTLDCEDGAPVGGEADHAAMVVALVAQAAAALARDEPARIGAMVTAAVVEVAARQCATLASLRGERRFTTWRPLASGRGPVAGWDDP
jgi:citrate lyase subunit beta/citryl-CoA lyase